MLSDIVPKALAGPLRKHKRALQYALFAVVLVCYGIWVVKGLVTHEPWRDEVRALGVARSAQTLFEIPSLLYNEGHPPLWYALLHVVSKFVPAAAALPVSSFLCAFVFVGLFLFFSPFGLFTKLIFPLTVFPAYEYSIMARNYAISVPLIFVAAILHRRRKTLGVCVSYSLVLMALGATNAVALIFAGLLWLDWCFEPAPKKLKKHLLGIKISTLAIFLATGIGLIPPRDSIIVRTAQLGRAQLSHAANDMIRAPTAAFRDLIVNTRLPFLEIGSLHTVVFLALMLVVWMYFDRRSKLIFAAYCLILSIFFKVIYYGGLRHLGIFWFSFVFLAWINPKCRKLIPSLAIFVLMAGQISSGLNFLRVDEKNQQSSSLKIGRYLREYESQNQNKDIIIIPEPDVHFEAVAGFLDHVPYLPRIGAFKRWTIFTKAAKAELSLAELLETASKQSGRVILALGVPELRDQLSSGQVRTTRVNVYYDKFFSWTAKDVALLKKRFKLAKSFWDVKSTENFDIWIAR